MDKQEINIDPLFQNIKTLSERLTSQYGMGFSAKNLELMRNFFLLYSKTQTLSALLEPEQNKTVTESGSIPQTLSAKLGSGNRPVWLSWSHYYYDRCIIAENENQTIGIVLCKQKDQTLVEMTLPVDNNQIFAAKYQTVLPNKEQLKQILEEGYNG